MKTTSNMASVLLRSIAFSLVALPATARAVAIRSGNVLYLQASETGAPLGKLNVPAQVMASHCITMVSPTYPQITNGSPRASSVIVRVVISKSGTVAPMRVVSGPPSLEAEAMSTVRQWRYKPFLRDGEPLDVTTDIRVDFDPSTPAGLISHPNH